MTLERSAEALENFKRAIAIKPDYAEAFYNQGNALKGLDRYDEALKSYDRAIALRPSYAKPHCNRGSVLDILGRPADALVCYDRALAIQPDFAEAMLNRCGALRGLKRIDETMQSLERLLTVHPAYAEAHVMRGMLMADFNRYRRGARELRTGAGAEARLQQGALGLVHGGAADPLRRGKRDRGAARGLRAASACASRRLRRRAASPAICPRVLARRSRSSSPTRVRTIASCRACSAPWPRTLWHKRYGSAELAPPPAAGEPVRRRHRQRLFLSALGLEDRRQGLGQPTRSETVPGVRLLPRQRQDSETALARQLCHRFVQGPASTERWRQIILADRPHVLIYPDIGMSTEASELAALRLAPVQCGYIGHPQTSGFPTLDYFLSGELIEPANGQDHYVEKLVKLPNAGFHYEPLELPPATVTREELGLRPNSTAYWCAQSLFKYLPQHDEVFPRIAREAGDCQFVFIRHFGRGVTELFQKRLDRAFAAAGLKADDHCVFLDEHGDEPLRRGERAVRSHARQHRLVGRQHHA